MIITENKAFDIIGDVHGHADTLEQLLQKMGYYRKAGVYTHNENRKVFFVGDFIDRGPKIRETLHLVKDMCDTGNAFAVMGNHEFNAICFHKPHIEKGGFFRDHSYTEISQHLETLKQFHRFPSEWETFLLWFETLPLWFEHDDFRMVHACWQEDDIRYLKENYKGMSAAFLEKATDNRSKEYHAVEAILKGIEGELPGAASFYDKDGNIRKECRVKWWALPETRKTLDDYFVDCPDEFKKIVLANDLQPGYVYTNKKPVFFGHYWLKGTPEIENSNAICLDYSVAKGGKLVAYSLDTKKMTYV